MITKNYQFWISYLAVWLLFALGLVVVGIWRREIQLSGYTLLAIIGNVAPGVLLGILVIKLCSRLKWENRQRAKFLIVHILLAIIFASLWCVFAIVDLSILTFATSKVGWKIVWMSSTALNFRFFLGLMTYLTIASAVYAREFNEQLQIEERRSAELEMRAVRAEAARSQAELFALRAQLNPHFLFNTLHSLMALVRYHPQLAEDALERLSEMLRYTLGEKRELNAGTNLVSLREEWQFVQNYLTLEKMRLEKRLITEFSVSDSALDCFLPAFTLQTIVENAVKHGIAPRAETGTIFIAAEKKEDCLEIEVRDNGRGAAEDFSFGNGMGLSLVQKQLEIYYGENAQLIVDTAPQKGFTVKISLPAKFVSVEQQKEVGKIEDSHVPRRG
jgi:sensor histidine kinase YesM